MTMLGEAIAWARPHALDLVAVCTTVVKGEPVCATPEPIPLEVPRG